MTAKQTVTYPTQYGHHTIPVEINRDWDNLLDRHLAQSEREVRQCERKIHIEISEKGRQRENQ